MMFSWYRQLEGDIGKRFSKTEHRAITTKKKFETLNYIKFNNLFIKWHH